jgi:ribosomal protein S27E
MNKIKIITEKKPKIEVLYCPRCGNSGGLFSCSRGAVNCSDCGQYVGDVFKNKK